MRGKAGSKYHLLVGAAGLPLNVLVSGANRRVGGVRSGQCTPLFGRTLTEFRLARDQSSPPR